MQDHLYRLEIKVGLNWNQSVCVRIEGRRGTLSPVRTEKTSSRGIYIDDSLNLFGRVQLHHFNYKSMGWNGPFICFKRPTVVGSAWSFFFFTHATTTNDVLYQILSITLFSYLIFWERASISLFNVEYWYHFYNVFGMTRSLTGDWTRDLPHSMPAFYH